MVREATIYYSDEAPDMVRLEVSSRPMFAAFPRRKDRIDHTTTTQAVVDAQCFLTHGHLPERAINVYGMQHSHVEEAR